MPRKPQKDDMKDKPDTNSISIELVNSIFYLVSQEEDTFCLGDSKYIDDVLDELKVYLEAMKGETT